MDYDLPPEPRNTQEDEWRKMYLEQRAETERLRYSLKIIAGAADSLSAKDLRDAARATLTAHG